MTKSRDKGSRGKDSLETTVRFGPAVPKGEQAEPVVAGVKTRARELFDALSPDDKNRVEAYFGSSRFDQMTDGEDAPWNAEERTSVYQILDALARTTDVAEKVRLAQQLGRI
ncbi:MAG: hypothetical protein WC817_01225 [Patescibacteria group bacterium]|jgi:hypothetical protein